MTACRRPSRRAIRSRQACVASTAETLRAAIAAASSVSVRSVTRRTALEHGLEVGGLLGEREIGGGALDGARQRGDLGLGSSDFRRTGLTHGGPDSSRGGRRPAPSAWRRDYFFLSAVACLATTWSLILSYVAAGTTFFFTRSSLRAYGRFSTIFLAYASPMPGRAFRSSSLAVLRSSGAFLSALVSVLAAAGLGSVLA